jgi:hypothetical protein
VVKTQYNQIGPLRTIELILGLPPVNQLDATATPLSDCFIGATHAVSGMMLDLGQYLRGFEQFMMDLYVNERFAHRLIGKLADDYLSTTGEFIRVFEGGVCGFGEVVAEEARPEIHARVMPAWRQRTSPMPSRIEKTFASVPSE